MANSKYAYVRNFELPDPLLPGTFMLYRLDGHSFHRYDFVSWMNDNKPKGLILVDNRFSDQHGFKKPNDVRALELMDHAAKDVMTEYSDIVLAFGESDEFRWADINFSKYLSLHFYLCSNPMCSVIGLGHTCVTKALFGLSGATAWCLNGSRTLHGDMSNVW